MKILIVGSGGREHAIAHAIQQSPLVSEIYVAPGNAGTESFAINVNIPPTHIEALKEFAKGEKIDLTIVGPEQPLADGLVDSFQKSFLKIFGPTKVASEIESSKSFTKDFCRDFDIPSADYETFTSSEEAKNYLKSKNQYPIVLKADGLAAGKGVIIAESEEEGLQAISEMMDDAKFGEAGAKLVIEDFLTGEEASYIAICDGENYVALPTSQDHKRALDDDKGPNTGGMGAYSPAPVITRDVQKKIESQIIEPTLKGLQEMDRPYTGFLYAGLMISPQGEPSLIEYNCRLGDPETQVILPRLKTDLLTLILKALDKKLGHASIDVKKESCVGIVLASGGYPGSYKKELPIDGLENIDPKKALVFHAGTKKDNDSFLTNGGRVLVVSSFGTDLQAAIDNTYKEAEKITFANVHYRKDIGKKGLKHSS